MNKIYVLKKDKIIKGPYTLKELNVKGVKENDLIWYEGLKDWTSIENLPEFRSLITNISTPTESKPLLQKILHLLKRKK